MGRDGGLYDTAFISFSPLVGAGIIDDSFWILIWVSGGRPDRQTRLFFFFFGKNYGNLYSPFYLAGGRLGK